MHPNYDVTLDTFAFALGVYFAAWRALLGSYRPQQGLKINPHPDVTLNTFGFALTVYYAAQWAVVWSQFWILAFAGKLMQHRSYYPKF